MINFKFKSENYSSNKTRSSHLLNGLKIHELNKFVTFDSESTTKFYHNEQEITRDNYEILNSNEKYKVFNLKLITACFIDNGKIINKVYIYKDSDYKYKKIDFFINKFKERILIKANIKYYDDSFIMCKDFYTDILNFQKSDKQMKVFCHNVKHDWLQCKTFMLTKIFNDIELKNFRFTIPRFLTFNLTGKKNLMFLDTVNYFQNKLEILGEEIGILKRKEDVDFNKELIVDKKFLKYALVDSLILAYKLIEFNIQTKNLGKIGFGIASTAYNIWRTSFMTEKIWLHKNPCLMKIERMTYAGGRVEAFKLGYFKNLFGLDVKSQYPFQMLNNLPIRYIKSLRAFNLVDENILYRKFNELKDKYCMICEIEVDSTLKIPITFLKHKGKLLFVNGKLNCVMAQPEIEILLKYNEKIIFKGIHIYKKGKAFKNYSEFFYTNKEKHDLEGNTGLKNFYKLMLNSVYGKTGEREIEEITKSCNKDYIGKIIEVINNTEYHFNCLCSIMKASKFLDSDGKNAFIPIASFITSYARAYLYDSMFKIGLENILYCDTDSIFTTLSEKEIIKRLNVGNKLGNWEIQYKNIDMIIHGVKDYIIIENGKILKQKLKGINLKTSIEIEKNEFLCERWTTINDGIKCNDLAHQKIILMEKKLKREYTKAQVLNPKLKKIKIDEKKIEYIESNLRHFNINDII